MSINFQQDDCYLLSHQNKLNDTFKAPILSDGRLRTFAINPHLFEINTVYGRDAEAEIVAENEAQVAADEQTQEDKQSTTTRKRRRKKGGGAQAAKTGDATTDAHRSMQELLNTVTLRQIAFQKSLHNASIMPLPCAIVETNNSAAIALAQSIQDDSPAPCTLHGANPLPTAVLSTVNQCTYLIPPRCEFFQNDVRNLATLPIPTASSTASGFDLVVIDPPWWNRYVRRAKRAKPAAGYEMLDSQAITDIPLERYIRAGSLVAIWCTNAPSHVQLVLETLLGKWELRLLSTWFWVKVTRSGRPVCEFREPLQKQPFERLFVACHRDSEVEKFTGLEQTRYLFSVPSAVHSHKPPVTELFQHLLPAQPRCLEIFARYLQPDFTSIGFEVLKLQNRKLFVNVDDDGEGESLEDAK